jgi:Ca2+/Na+ antiporter
MKHKSALFGMIITTAIFAALLFMGLSSVDPRTAQWTGFVVVTIALILFAWGLIGTLMLAHKTFRKKDRSMAVIMRQASFLSLVVVLAMYLQRFELLTWWNVVVLIALVVLIEVFFIGKEEVQEF